jgi:hypothetical protein
VKTAATKKRKPRSSREDAMKARAAVLVPRAVKHILALRALSAYELDAHRVSRIMGTLQEALTNLEEVLKAPKTIQFSL